MDLIKHQGTLYKSPPISKFQNQSSWHYRHFVLAKIGNSNRVRKISWRGKKNDEKEKRGKHVLIYWKNEEERRAGKPYKGKILLHNCSVSAKGTLQFPRLLYNVIELTTPKRTYYLSAASHEEMKRWQTVLESSIFCDEQDTEELTENLYATITDVVNAISHQDKDFADSGSISSGISSGGSISSSGSATIQRASSNGSCCSRGSASSISSRTNNKGSVKFSDNVERICHEDDQYAIMSSNQSSKSSNTSGHMPSRGSFNRYDDENGRIPSRGSFNRYDDENERSTTPMSNEKDYESMSAIQPPIFRRPREDAQYQAPRKSRSVSVDCSYGLPHQNSSPPLFANRRSPSLSTLTNISGWRELPEIGCSEWTFNELKIQGPGKKFTFSEDTLEIFVNECLYVIKRVPMDSTYETPVDSLQQMPQRSPYKATPPQKPPRRKSVHDFRPSNEDDRPSSSSGVHTCIQENVEGRYANGYQTPNSTDQMRSEREETKL